MNERIKKLREQSITAVNMISHERAVLMTEFYKKDQGREVSPPVKRALSFKYLLENITICINNGELIVGERGPAPKATPTYPEICLHTLGDLDILNSRKKVSFKVEDSTKEIYDKEIIPFWSGKTNRDRMFDVLPQMWIDSYEAGVFTEFQEQRAPGHTVLGDKIYKKGFLNIKNDINKALQKLDYFNDPNALDKYEELKGMSISTDALMIFSHRYAEELDKLSVKEKDKTRKEELQNMSIICRKVPANPPETFWEALQYYWFVHLGVIIELNPWDSFNPGRLDQHLYPFYKKELENGSLTKEGAKELLQSFWIKFNNHPSPPKMGVTAKESNTYTDFALINLGGLKEDGSNAVNDLSYIILDVIEEMRILQPSSMVQLSNKNPDKFIKRALEIIKSGFGQPSIFNTDAIIKELLRQGKKINDARNGGASGCVETGAFGTESYILTGYFNLTKILEITLNNGKDPRSGKTIGLNTGDPTKFKNFDELLSAYKNQLLFFADIKIEGNNIIERIFAKYMPVPFLSLLIDDCVSNGVDYNAGGARYNTSYIQGVGLGSITDCLSSLKYNIFDKKLLTMSRMLEIMKKNFIGEEEWQNKFVNHSPKYGNDDNYADDIMKEVFESFFQAVDGRKTARGGVFRINLLPTTSHIYFGSVIGALPNGREAEKPLSEGISPSQACDTNGPTSVIKSAAKIDHIRTGGTLLNQKFTPDFLNNEKGINSLTHLVRSYFKMQGHHIQFNVISADTLRKAQKEPELYKDLIVRVAGYSDYFNDLTEELQNEIIKRTEHQSL